ncbi:major facilitator superfamily domain-containing protein 2B-like protein [Lates japonicus]|uniref:Major facilitator superfamily domain-containing protein 2B-like protein n=1 Tax=Lates japonicus TaxID=270547 RepID=A0AAD3NIB3_LATJO|nr:major facilitator superfamily domain-containing protein 2B-like protein [Lates japonicus]
MRRRLRRMDGLRVSAHWFAVTELRPAAAVLPVALVEQGTRSIGCFSINTGATTSGRGKPGCHRGQEAPSAKAVTPGGATHTGQSRGFSLGLPPAVAGSRAVLTRSQSTRWHSLTQNITDTAVASPHSLAMAKEARLVLRLNGATSLLVKNCRSRTPPCFDGAKKGGREHTDLSQKLPLCSKLCFAIGGAPKEVAASATAFFLQIYLLDVAQITAFQASMVLFIGKAWGAVTDPIVGFFITKSRWTKIGRLMPCLKFCVAQFGLPHGVSPVPLCSCGMVEPLKFLVSYFSGSFPPHHGAGSSGTSGFYTSTKHSAQVAYM